MEKIIRPHQWFFISISGFLIGIFLGNLGYLSWNRSGRTFLFGLIVFSLLTVAFILLRTVRKAIILTSFLCFVWLGLIYGVHFLSKLHDAKSLEGKLTFQLDLPLQSSGTGQEFIAKIINFSPNNKLSGDSNWQGKEVLLQLSPFPQFHYGECLSSTGTLTSLDQIANSGTRNFAQAKGASYVGKLYGSNPVDCSLTSWQKTVRLLLGVKDKVIGNILQALPEPEASLSASILLGGRANLSQTFVDDLSKTGLTHIIAISGYNVGIIVLVLGGFLLSVFGRKISFSLTFLLVIGLVIMTGATASVVRAALFALLIASARLIGRPTYIPNILLLVAVMMLFSNPLLLNYDLGFQLSFLAFLGLIYLGPLINHYIEKIKVIPGAASNMFAETLGAQLAVAPLLFSQFGTVSIIAPVANLLVLGVIPLTMWCTLAIALVGFISPWLAKIAGLILLALVKYIIIVVSGLASVSWSSLKF